MVSLLVYSDKLKEIDLYKEMASDTIAKSGDRKLEFIPTRNYIEFQNVIKTHDILNLAIVDITLTSGLEIVKALKAKYFNIEIMLIADSSISPMVYINPKIKPASLILKPYKKKDLETVIYDFVSLIEEESEKDGRVFWIENQSDKISVPFDSIYYFEAREKKVFIRLGLVEYYVYETIEKLAADLPDDFIRCHRSYIVNKKFISKIKFAENIILLDDDKMVPLSRSYKPQLKGIVKNGQ